jgi:hypothetical protein
MDDSDERTRHRLRLVDRKRLDAMQERFETPLAGSDIWYIHTVLAQCFLPYRDPKANHWQKQNGKYSIILTSGALQNPKDSRQLIDVGLPYGPKPRLFQSYICTQVVKQQSPVVPIERSMTAMMKELGYDPRGGEKGNIASFKEQITRFAACHFTIVGPGSRGAQTYIKTPPIKKFHIPSDLVVDQWVSNVESSSPRDFLLLHDLWTTFRHLLWSQIISAISTAWDFTTKSGGM